MTKMIWCPQVYRNICFNRNVISSCTVGNNSKNLKYPLIKILYYGEKIDWDAFFESRQEILENFKKGIIPEECEGCQYLTEIDSEQIDTDFKLGYIQVSNYLNCNSDCIYCTNHKKPQRFKRESYDIYPVIKDLIKGNYITEKTTIDFAGGEPTIYYSFNSIIKMLLKESPVRNIIVHTNAIKYSKEIELGIKQDRLTLCVSPDSGSKGMHETIKRVKTFDVVWKNIKKYAKARPKNNKNEIKLKYIIIPWINDTKEEIEKWILLSNKVNPDCLILNADCRIYIKGNNTPEVMDKLVELSDFFIEYCQRNNIHWEIQYNIRAAYVAKNLSVPYQYRDK